ncbi:MAG: VOC family protein [Pseudomonadales bacterium]|nr:VOC family protein [Pseudomonadales bacterium]
MAVKLQKAALDAGIVTVDGDRAAHFYGEVLGLPQAGEVQLPGIGLVRRYAIGDSTLRVFVPQARPQREGSRDGMASQTGIRYLTLMISNLDEAVAAIAAAGYKVPVAIRVLRPGVRVAQVEDADGNAIELMQQDA